jgi:hypothetical protein
MENVCVYLSRRFVSSLIDSERQFMKTIFKNNNRGRSTLYILFALAFLALVVLFFCANLIPVYVYTLIFTFILICIMSMGGLIIQIRSGPPW